MTDRYIVLHDPDGAMRWVVKDTKANGITQVVIAQCAYEATAVLTAKALNEADVPRYFAAEYTYFFDTGKLLKWCVQDRTDPRPPFGHAVTCMCVDKPHAQRIADALNAQEGATHG